MHRTDDYRLHSEQLFPVYFVKHYSEDLGSWNKLIDNEIFGFECYLSIYGCNMIVFFYE
jgi:hypothetical protein